MAQSNEEINCEGERVHWICFLLIDGLSDVAYPSLSDLTPLQAAKSPTLDALAEFGVNGLLDPVEPGLACGSDTAHLSILGYDPREFYRGRGSFESMGAGLEMHPGDIAFKCNFATMDIASSIVTSRRADRNFEKEGPILCQYLDGTPIPGHPEYSVSVKYATEHRCGVVLRGPNLSERITGTDPLKDNLPMLECKACHPGDKDAEHTAQVVQALHKALQCKLIEHPINKERATEGKSVANIVLLRGAGVRIEAPTFEQTSGWSPFVIAPTAIIAGLGMSLGMEVVKVEGATGDYHTNLDAKGRAFLQTMRARGRGMAPEGTPPVDFGFLHIKAVDDAGHDGREGLKRDLIQRADSMMHDLILGLWELKPENVEVSVVVTGDHSTLCIGLDHSCEPVPLSLCRLSPQLLARVKGEGSTEGRGAWDGVKSFDEVAAAGGALGRFPGAEVVPTIRKFCALPSAP